MASGFELLPKKQTVQGAFLCNHLIEHEMFECLLFSSVTIAVSINVSPCPAILRVSSLNPNKFPRALKTNYKNNLYQRNNINHQKQHPKPTYKHSHTKRNQNETYDPEPSTANLKPKTRKRLLR